MEKVIKVIDLLNMIANGEELPKKIKYDDEIFELINNNYKDLVDDNLTDYIAYDFSNLNDEVEILEDEEQEIDIQYLKEIENIESWKAIDEDIRNIVKNMNILTRAIKQLDKQIKDK